MLAGEMQMVADPNGTAATHGTKGFVTRGLKGTRLLTTENNVRLVHGSMPTGWSRASLPGMANHRASRWNLSLR